MCGIVAILGRPSTRAIPPSEQAGAGLGAAVRAITGWGPTRTRLGGAGDLATGVDRLLRGSAGVTALLDGPELQARLLAVLDELDARVTAIETGLEAGSSGGG